MKITKTNALIASFVVLSLTQSSWAGLSFEERQNRRIFVEDNINRIDNDLRIIEAQEDRFHGELVATGVGYGISAVIGVAGVAGAMYYLPIAAAASGGIGFGAYFTTFLESVGLGAYTALDVTNLLSISQAPLGFVLKAAEDQKIVPDDQSVEKNEILFQEASGVNIVIEPMKIKLLKAAVQIAYQKSAAEFEACSALTEIVTHCHYHRFKDLELPRAEVLKAVLTIEKAYYQSLVEKLK